MYTIGQFSRIVRASAKTLRWYDEVGLFKPAAVGADNQYRFYTAGQVAEFQLILFLRGLGVGLEEIRRLIAAGAGAEAFAQVLQAQAEATRAQVEAAQTVLSRIEAALSELRREGQVSELGVKVSVKEIPGLTAVAVRRRIKLGEFPELMNEVFARLRCAPAGPPLARYFDEDFDPEDLDVEVLVPVSRGGDLELPATRAASYLHVGPYERLSEAYQALFAWVNDHLAGQGLKMVGPVREVYLVGPGSGRPPEEYVTELQVPVG